MFNPSEQTTITIIAYQINFIWYISTYLLMAYEPNKGSVFSHLSSVLPYGISTINGAYRFRRVVFPCKGREARSHTKNRGYSETNFAQNLPQIAYNLGIPQNFFQNFLVKAT